jgi:hypothetical protein
MTVPTFTTVWQPHFQRVKEEISASRHRLDIDYVYFSELLRSLYHTIYQFYSAGIIFGQGYIIYILSSRIKCCQVLPSSFLIPLRHSFIISFHVYFVPGCTVDYYRDL